MTEILQLAEEIIQGRRLTSTEECLPLLTADLEALASGADRIRQALCGDKINLCAIVNGRSGRCSEDCKFCAQSRCNPTGVEEYPFLPLDQILGDAGEYDALGVDRYSIVTAGRGLSGGELDKAAAAYAAIHEAFPDLKLCGSHGMMTVEGFRQLRAAGVDMVHCNVETSREFFPSICTSHSYEEKLDNIRRAREAGMQICCGGIIGMGERPADRISMALTIQETGAVSIPLNILVPIPGTPLEDMPLLAPEEILRTVAIFRCINPEAQIRIAAGRFRFGDGGLALFRAGASATITGNMLTTTGNSTREDREMLKAAGFTLRDAPAFNV